MNQTGKCIAFVSRCDMGVFFCADIGNDPQEESKHDENRTGV